MSSRRIYITLNDNKEKDKVILNYLSNSYSEGDAIKEALYRSATNSTQKVQKQPKNDSKIKGNIIPKSDKMVQKGAKWCERVRNGTDYTKINSTEKVQKDTVINKNEIDQLKEFM